MNAPINIEEYRKRFPGALPKKSWFQPEKSKTMKAECPESVLQRYMNTRLQLKRWPYLRFPDGFLRWMKLNAPPNIQAIFFGQVGGRMPDALVMVPLGKGFFLARKIELKTQDKKGRAVGRTHGKQKQYAEAEGWPICRSPEAIDKALSELETAGRSIAFSKAAGLISSI